ncbi:hypothetical protein HZC21_04930 [Candidatus Peregrinibacteria bacterium]|nr:hypothetical protein [Candidatus Peregrinibacteria bacterium]MBI5732877.1 hypothetical protein [Candidatus Jorgensenbacteria bacterium]
MDEFLKEYGWFVLAFYWLIGFIGFYLEDLWHKKKYGWSYSPGFWNSFLSALLYGLIWPAFYFGGGMIWVQNKIEEKTGVYINFMNILGMLCFGYLTLNLVFSFTQAWNGGTLVWLLIALMVTISFGRGITGRPKPNIPKWVERSIEKEIAEYEEMERQHEAKTKIPSNP